MMPVILCDTRARIDYKEEDVGVLRHRLGLCEGAGQQGSEAEG